VGRKVAAGLVLISMMLLAQIAFSTAAVSATDFSKVGVKNRDWAQYNVSESINRTLASRMNISIGSFFQEEKT
jgi:cytochrome oxidase Cu insertion factor (SCO1/SenC/PrrC family)